MISLARALPQVTIVMCHVGGVLGYGAYAGKKDEVHAAWRASMAELATCPNVSVKLGGMLNRGAALNFRELPTPSNSATWAAAWQPYVEPCIELFGAERCTFESNVPVDKMGTGYATLWNAFKRITAGCSQIEKLALYSGTAKRLYHLDRGGQSLAASCPRQCQPLAVPSASKEAVMPVARNRHGRRAWSHASRHDVPSRNQAQRHRTSDPPPHHGLCPGRRRKQPVNRPDRV